MQWMHIIYARTHSFRLFKFVCTICFVLSVNVLLNFEKYQNTAQLHISVKVIIILYKDQ